MAAKRKSQVKCPVCLNYFKKSVIAEHRKTHWAKLAPISDAIRNFRKETK